jgi:hypothetical protein
MPKQTQNNKQGKAKTSIQPINTTFFSAQKTGSEHAVTSNASTSNAGVFKWSPEISNYPSFGYRQGGVVISIQESRKSYPQAYPMTENEREDA